MNNRNKDLFEKIGIDINKDKINIDMNQTKDFFNTLKNMFEAGAENIQKDLADGRLDMEKNIGIKIDKDNINIDLTKTKSFIEEIGEKIEQFIGGLDTAVDNLDKAQKIDEHKKIDSK